MTVSVRQIERSRKTRHVATVNGFKIFAHTLSAVAGTHIVVWNETDWESAPDISHAVRVAQGTEFSWSRPTTGAKYWA